MKIYPPLVRVKYEQLIDPIRQTARALGYAIGVHGSLARDIDLIAVPWRKHAVEPQELAEAIVRVATEAGDWMAKAHDLGKATVQPHGRLSFVVNLDGGTYIDLSVMPPAERAAQEGGGDA